MATSKKKSTKRASSKVVKKAPVKATKAVVKKSPMKKKEAAKKPAAKKVTSAPSTEKVVVVRRRWFSFFRTSAMILVLAAGAALVSLDPAMLTQLKASILAQVDSLEDTAEPAVEANGVLLSYEQNGANEEKLMDIFRTVFPETAIREVPYDSEEGKRLINDWGVTEVPNIYFEKTAFESEKLSEVVKDLFRLQGDYYGLNVSLVNPSGQVKIKGSLSTEGGVWIGEEAAPLTVYIYSDTKCQHCRANERNTAAEWKKLADEGMVRLVYLDLPQDAESTFHSTALTCYYDQKKDANGYLELRGKLSARANLTKAFTLRELERAGLNYEQECDEAAYRMLFRNRIKTAEAEGVTGIPALYIGMTAGDKYIRFTGAKDFAEYQQTLDKLLGEVNQGTAGE
ncbi:MAG: DsbA family protein [Candidatus Altimarinota bacterium]